MKGHFRLRNTAAALLVLGALTAAGCGSSSNSSSNFKSDFNAEYTNLKALGTSIVTEVQGAGSKTNVALAAAFNGLAARVSTAVTKLNSLHPPANASADFNNVKASMTQVEADLKSIANAATANNPTVAKQAAATLVVDAQKTKTSIDALKKDIGS